MSYVFCFVFSIHHKLYLFCRELYQIQFKFYLKQLISAITSVTRGIC